MNTRERRTLVRSAMALLLIALLPYFNKSKRAAIEVSATATEAPAQQELGSSESLPMNAGPGRAPASLAKPIDLESCQREVVAAEHNGAEAPPPLSESENIEAMSATEKMRELYDDFENYVIMPDGRKLTKRSVNFEFDQQLQRAQADPTRATGI